MYRSVLILPLPLITWTSRKGILVVDVICSNLMCVSKMLHRLKNWISFSLPSVHMWGAGMAICGEQGWRSSESARLPPMWPGFDSGTRRHMWVEFVVSSRPCSEGFSPGTPVFLAPQNLTFLNSNSIWNSSNV